MSFPKETMIELMSYADGDELDAAARARVEELLRTSEEARRVVGAMGTLGEVVREGVSDRLGRSKADGIADGVMAAIARESGGKVVPIARAGRSRVGTVVAFAAALAVAAGVLFVVGKKAPTPMAVDDSMLRATGARSIAATPIAPAAAVAQVEAHGVDLEEVRSVENKVNVFFMPKSGAAGATSSVVVWIDDRHGGH